VKVIIFDEVHNTITSIYKDNVLENQDKILLGLSATPQESNRIYPDIEDETLNLNVYQSEEDTVAKRITDYCTKGQFYQMFLPIVFRYTLEDGIKDGILSPFRTVVVEHHLDDSNSRHLIWKTKKVYGTEKKYYEQKWNFATNYRIKLPKYLRMNILMHQLPKFLYSLESKIKPAIIIKNRCEERGEKNVIFTNDIATLRKIIPDSQIVARTKEDGTTKSDKELYEIIDRFNKGEILTVGSCEILKQGITLEGVNNLIRVAYNSTSKDLEQLLGRVIRFVPGKIAKHYIFVTKGTMEEKWLKKMVIKKDKKGKKSEIIDLNIMGYIDSRVINNKYEKEYYQSRTKSTSSSNPERIK